jgi:hypothetical protein
MVTRNQEELSVAKATLLSVMDSNPSKYSAIKAQLGRTKSLAPHKLFFGKKIQTNSDLNGIVDIIKVTDAQQEGLRNIDKGKLQDGQIFVATRIKFSYANAATSANDADQVLFSNKLFSPTTLAVVTINTVDYPVPVQRIPTKVLNAEFSLYRGNNKYFFSLVQDLIKENSLDVANGVGSNNHSTSFELKNPIVFDAETAFKAELKMPLNGTAGTLDHFVRIEWEGFMVADV